MLDPRTGTHLLLLNNKLVDQAGISNDVHDFMNVSWEYLKNDCLHLLLHARTLAADSTKRSV